jgi:hypothetical protein
MAGITPNNRGRILAAMRCVLVAGIACFGWTMRWSSGTSRRPSHASARRSGSELRRRSRSAPPKAVPPAPAPRDHQPRPTKQKSPVGCRGLLSTVCLCFSRGGQIRTADLSDPNRARYQTALRPETEAADNGLRGAICQGRDTRARQFFCDAPLADSLVISARSETPAGQPRFFNSAISAGTATNKSATRP